MGVSLHPPPHAPLSWPPLPHLHLTAFDAFTVALEDVLLEGAHLLSLTWQQCCPWLNSVQHMLTPQRGTGNKVGLGKRESGNEILVRKSAPTYSVYPGQWNSILWSPGPELFRTQHCHYTFPSTTPIYCPHPFPPTPALGGIPGRTERPPNGLQSHCSSVRHWHSSVLCELFAFLKWFISK
jgi:hypothetical protein